MEQWADSNSLSFIHNAKLQKSFNSVIWKEGYNPDIIFVSSNISDRYDTSVLDPIPRTQHRTICVTVNSVIVPQPTTSRRRFTLNKVQWDRFQLNLMQPSNKLMRLQTTQPTSGEAVTAITN